MDIAVADEAPRVARLYRTEPERCVRRLRRQDVRDVGPLDVLVVQRGRVEHRVLAWCIGAIDVDRKPGTVPHGDADVPFLDHRFTRAFATLSDVGKVTNQVFPPDQGDYAILLYDRKV